MSLDVNAVKSTFELIKPIVGEVVSTFYETLFSSYPEIEALFKASDMEKEKRTAVTTLVRIVDGLENLNELKNFLRTLGSQHFKQGVTEEHYAIIGKSLLSTLRYFFKENWNSRLEDQWILVLGFIADQMLEGAKTAALRSTPIRSAPPLADHQDLSQMVRQIARNILLSALEAEMDSDFTKSIQKKATNLLTQAIRAEAEEMQMNFASQKKMPQLR